MRAGGCWGCPSRWRSSFPAVSSAGRPAFAALVIASLASFVVYVPLTVLALNGGGALAEDTPAPALTARAYGVLLALWTTTAWLAAAAAPHLT